MDTLSIKIALWWLISIVIASQDNNAGVGRHQHLHLHRPQNVFNNSIRLPIVYVYTVVPAVCKGGLPEYIRTSVEQGIDTQPLISYKFSFSPIILANCPVFANSFQVIH